MNWASRKRRCRCCQVSFKMLTIPTPTPSQRLLPDCADKLAPGLCARLKAFDKKGCAWVPVSKQPYDPWSRESALRHTRKQMDAYRGLPSTRPPIPNPPPRVLCALSPAVRTLEQTRQHASAPRRAQIKWSVHKAAALLPVAYTRFLEPVEKPPPLAQPQHQDRAQRWSLRKQIRRRVRAVCVHGGTARAAVASATLCHVLRSGSEPCQKEQDLHRGQAAVVLLREDMLFFTGWDGPPGMYCCSTACTYTCTNAGAYTFTNAGAYTCTNADLRSSDNE